MSTIKTKAGEVLGQLTILPAVAQKAAQIAKDFWKTQVADEFVEPVDTWEPREFCCDWLPTAALLERGYRPVSERHTWVMTTGVDAHIDRIWGPTLVWVLLNDGMAFKQGREKTIHKPGEWFIFSDAVSHEVNTTASSPEEAVFLGWSVQLEKL